MGLGFDFKSRGPEAQRSLGSAEEHRLKPVPLLFPVSVGELFAEGDFLELADGGAGDFGEEDEGGHYNGIGKRPQGCADSALRYRAWAKLTSVFVGSAVCSRR